jgi:hypothetical protein
MNFKHYLADVEKKTFKFQIKTLFPLTDEVMDLLEKALQKYRPAAMSKPKKTMMHSNPLGFTGVKMAEVFMFDVELTVPVTPLILQYDLRDILHLHKDAKELKVFGHGSEELGEEMTIGEDEEADKSALLTNENYEEVEEAKFEDNFGDSYNEKFLSYLKKVEAERAAATGRGAKVDSNHPITKWSDQPEGDVSDADTEQKK